jgi:hypothetical protein
MPETAQSFRKGLAMMRRKALIVGLLSLGLAASAGAADRNPQRGEQQLAKIIGDRIPGKPVSCINLSSIRSSQIVDGTAIVYEVGSRLYVNRPDAGASTLNDDDILVTKTFTGQLCDIDTVNVVDRTSRFWRGFVGLGKFVPYERIKLKTS